MRWRVGIDTGGTFTDFVLLEEETGRVVTAKVFHGTTAATNAILEGKTGRTGLVTTAGFRDVIEIRRHVRGQGRIYDLAFRPPEPLYGFTNHITISAEDPESGRTWVAFEIQPGGWGGRPALDGNDGCSAHMHDVRNVPVELEQTTYPIRVERYELIRDSGGPGRQRGGLGLRRDLRLLAPEACLTIHCDRFRFAAPGMRGGGAARCTINPDTPRAVELTSKATNVPPSRGGCRPLRLRGRRGLRSARRARPRARHPRRETRQGQRRGRRGRVRAGRSPSARGALLRGVHWLA
jgi:hypothetical protein